MLFNGNIYLGSITLKPKEGCILTAWKKELKYWNWSYRPDEWNYIVAKISPPKLLSKKPVFYPKARESTLRNINKLLIIF